MKPSRMIPGALVVASVAVASMFAAAPASAATLPPGQKITIIDQYTDQFYTANPADAVATPVGTPDIISEYVNGIDVDDAGLGYAVASARLDLDAVPESEADDKADLQAAPEALIALPGGWIYKADANTGKLSGGKAVLIDLPGDGDVFADSCEAVDYTKGVILAVCYGSNSEDGYATYIGTVDATSDVEVAWLTPLTTLTDNDESFRYFYAIAVSPIDGTIYGFDFTYPFASAWTITLDGAEPKYIGDLDEYGVIGADFDRGGQLWLTVAPLPEPNGRAANVSYFSLATFDFTSHQAVLVDQLSADEPNSIDGPPSITVWGALAATGSVVSVAPAIAASGILLLGAILAAGTMVLRRRNDATA